MRKKIHKKLKSHTSTQSTIIDGKNGLREVYQNHMFLCT
jgi:hypothetical protein